MKAEAIDASKQGRFQILDIVSVKRPVTKLTRRIADGNNIPSLVREAFRITEAEKPGSVHLEPPEDVAAEEVARAPFDVTSWDPPGASQSALETATRMIQEARHPLLLVWSPHTYGADAWRRDIVSPKCVTNHMLVRPAYCRGNPLTTGATI